MKPQRARRIGRSKSTLPLSLGDKLYLVFFFTVWIPLVVAGYLIGDGTQLGLILSLIGFGWLCILALAIFGFLLFIAKYPRTNPITNKS